MLPLVVLLPGLDGTGRLFDRLRRELDPEVESRSVSYPAARPLGYEALEPLVARVLPADRRYVVVAESFSGPLAVRLASRSPSGLAGLVLVSSFLRCPINVPSWLGILVTPATFWFPLPAVALRQLLVGRHASEDLVSEVQRAVRSVRSSVLAQRVREVIRVDVTREFAATRVPTLCLWGDQDAIVSREVASEMEATRPDVETCTVAAPHLVLQCAPAEAAAVIAAFVRRLGADEAASPA